MCYRVWERVRERVRERVSESPPVRGEGADPREQSSRSRFVVHGRAEEQRSTVMGGGGRG